MSFPLRQSYPHWNSRQSLDSHLKQSLFPLEQRKNFLEKLQKQIESNWKKRYYERLSKIWQTNRQTNIWTKTKKIDFQNSRLILELILNFYNFIQCNTIVQLTNYFSISIIKMHVFLHSGLIIYIFHNLWHEIYVIVYDICNKRHL